MTLIILGLGFAWLAMVAVLLTFVGMSLPDTAGCATTWGVSVVLGLFAVARAGDSTTLAVKVVLKALVAARAGGSTTLTVKVVSVVAPLEAASPATAAVHPAWDSSVVGRGRGLGSLLVRYCPRG